MGGFDLSWALEQIIAWADRIPGLSEYSDIPWIASAVFASMALGVLLFAVYFLSAMRTTSTAERRVKAFDHARSGDLPRAQKAFERMGDMSSAARIAEKRGRAAEALDLAVRAEDHGTAGRLLASAGRREEAAKAFERFGDLIAAGEQWEAAGKTEEAVDRYLRGGRVVRAESMLSRTGRFAQLGDLLVADFESRRKAVGPMPLPGDLDEVLQVACRAAEAYRKAKEFERAGRLYLAAERPIEAAACYRDAGETDRAAELFYGAGRAEEAAEILAASGKFERAAELYEEAGRSERVADLLAKAGKVQRAKEITAQLALDRNDIAEAARLFAEADNPRQAAQLYRDMGRIEDAAAMLEAAGSLEEAAEAFEQAGDFARAGRLYASEGRHGQAAVSLERASLRAEAEAEFAAAGRHFDAGRLAEGEGRVEEAIAHHQHVTFDSPDYARASHALARLFWRKGEHALAEEKFRNVLRNARPTADTVDIFYDFAVFLEQTGRPDNARKMYETVLAASFGYRDTKVRKQALEERLRTSPPADRDSAEPGEGVILAERYRIGRRLGAGAMGTIFHALDLKLDREVALKYLPGQGPEDAARFTREAQVAAGLTHHNIVKFFDAGKYRGTPFLVMEYVKGRDLKAVLKEMGRLSVARVRHIGIQVASALEYAHGEKVVHRDIKPANIMLTPEDTVKVTDFGVAKRLTKASLTMTQTVGTPLYIAPEQITHGRFDHRVDLYSLGVVLFELLTGRPPFTQGEVTYHHVHTNPPLLTSVLPGAPKVLEVLIAKLLAKDPNHRHKNAAEVRTELMGGSGPDF